MKDESAAALMMENNINQVWNERDPVARLKAIKKIYSVNANLYHVGNQVTGYDAINKSVTATQKILPANFVFTKLQPVIINNGIGRLLWGTGPIGQPSVATGMDIAYFEEGKIQSLYVFLDN